MSTTPKHPRAKRKKVIALYIVAGFGHLKPALALLEQMKQYPVETEAWDIFADDTGESVLDKNSLYNRISTNPKLIKIWNDLSSSKSVSRYLAHPAHWMDVVTKGHIIKRIRRVHRDNPETIFFSTHFTPANLASKALPKSKVFLYTTDIHLHPIWAIKRDNIIYLVPAQYTKDQLIKYGIKAKNIRIASYPIHPTLLKGNAARHKKRLKNLKKEKSTDILIISGGAGTGKLQMQNLLKTFSAAAHAHKVNITFLASTLKLREALKESRVEIGLPKNCAIIDTYKPDKLYEAMNWAEVLITKSGGDITFEALAEGLPVYTLKDVGDHEKVNREYMEKVGASRRLESGVYPWELIHHDILTGKIQKMAQASSDAGAFHREANVPKILFEEMGWKISRKGP